MKQVLLILIFAFCVSAQTPTPTPGVNINPPSATLKVGETLQAVVTDPFGNQFAAPWTLVYLPLAAEPNTCVTVNPTNGLVTGSRVGQCGVSVLAYAPGFGMLPARPISVTVIPVSRAIALHATTFFREPFKKGDPVAFFFEGIVVDSTNPVTVSLTDATGMKFTLPVFFNAPLSKTPIWQVNVTLPNTVALGDAVVCAVWKNLTTNCGLILIGP